MTITSISAPVSNDLRKLIVDYIYMLSSNHVYEIHTVDMKLANARLLLNRLEEGVPTQTYDDHEAPVSTKDVGSEIMEILIENRYNSPLMDGEILDSIERTLRSRGYEV